MSVTTHAPLFSWIKRHLSLVILVIVLAMASVLRLYHLDTNPPSPYWEETALGYDAFSIAKTGKDHHGNEYPLIAFPSFGDYKPSGYFYVLAPFIKVFGLSTLIVRLPSAIAGIIAVLMMYLLGKELWNERVGLVAAALFAISPWSLQFSRGGWEVNLALTFVLIGTWLLCRARKHLWSLVVSVFFFVAAMYTYHAARVYAPFLGAIGALVLIHVWTKDSQKKYLALIRSRLNVLLVSLIVALVAISPLLVNLKSSSVSSRFDATSIFSDPSAVLASNKQIQLHGNTAVSRLVYHRFWFYGGMIVKNYVSHFSPQFLFQKGDGNLRHGTVAFGLLYPVDALFLVIALARLIVTKDRKVLLPVVSILLAGIAPSLVTPTPHALRFLFAAPGFVMLTAYGIVVATRHCRFNQLLLRRAFVVLVYIIVAFTYLRYYHTVYPVKAASDWQYGYKELYALLHTEKKPGEAVYVTREQGRPAMYYLFLTSYDPATLQRAESTLPKDQLELLAVDDYHFVDAIPSTPGLFATSPAKKDPQAREIGVIQDLSGKIVWSVWRR